MIDAEAPPAKRRRRRNTTLMVLGILMAGGSTVAGGLGISNEVLVNALWSGTVMAAAGAGLYTWTYLDRIKLNGGKQ